MKRKTLFISFIVIGVLCLIASLVLYFLIDLDSYKPRIETAVSDTLGFPVKIEGDIGFFLFPNLHISIGKIIITGRESDMASLEKIAFGLKLLPLLKGKVIIDEVAIRRPEVSLVRFENGEFNFTQRIQKKTKEEEKDTPLFVAHTISLSDGDIVYSDHKNGTVTELHGVDIEIKDLLSGATGKKDLIKDISFKGSLKSKKITSHAVELSDFSFQIRAKEGLYNIRNLSTTLFSGKGTGEVTFDVTGKTPSLKIQTTFSKIHLDEFLHALSEKKSMEGMIDLSLNLEMKGTSMDEIRKTINGHTSMQGENIVIKNYDIDHILASYRNTQKIGALDIAAFFLAGPVGTAVTKGYDYEKLHMSTGTQGGIMKKLVYDWKVEKGIATAEDVAIATRKNRIAVKGNLNLVKDMYDNVIVAVIDQKGCAEVTQKIYGSLNNPQLEKTSIMQSAADSVLNLFDKAGKLIPGTQCEAFYRGAVQHPK